jgi:aldehyde dehydrogenase (NAD+)
MTDSPEAPEVEFETRMLIDGQLVDGQAGTFTNVNPATEQVLGEVADASSADMHRAIDAARRAFDETAWSTDHAFRQRCLLQLQEALEAEQEALREELILEVGCPRMVTHGPQLDAPLSAALIYPAKLIDEYPWETDLGDAMVDLTGQLTRRKIWREPVGVVGAIVPWNFPFEVTINKLGQALATGNTVVLKPAPDTPYNATRLGRLIAERTDIPAGVVNVVTASDHLVGEELTLSPKVDLISFTGSTAVGRRIMEKGAATMKRLFLELGGKSATIVLEDADLGLACLIGIAPCLHAGQGCATPTRMLLPRSRYDEGVEMLKGMYETVAVGDPQQPETLCGPVISARQRERILGYIQAGIDEGAKLVVGGTEAPEGLDTGFYVRPTLFVDVDNSMTIAQEEIFGPVLAVIPYDGEEEAIRIANDSQYGLAGNVMSGSLEHSLAVARRLRAGVIGVNGGAPYGADVPFGGYKASGVGRQNGYPGFDQYLEVKSVAWPVG